MTPRSPHLPLAAAPFQVPALAWEATAPQGISSSSVPPGPTFLLPRGCAKAVSSPCHSVTCGWEGGVEVSV